VHHSSFPSRGGPDELYNVRDHILTQAWNKFLVRVLGIVYRWGGGVVYAIAMVIHPEQIEEVLVTKGKAYAGRPAKNTKTDGKAGEVGVLASQSFVHEDVSGLT